MSNRIYKSIISAKNGSLIPELLNGRTVESRYNPDRDAEALLESINSKGCFYIVTGIASGIFINKLLERNRKSFIICIERCNEDIELLKTIPLVKALSIHTNIKFATPEEIAPAITQNYLPAKYGDYKIIENKNWLNENTDIIPLIQQEITKAIGIVSADYSVQAHFGKIWQKNIIDNLKILSKLKDFKNLVPDTRRNAYIIAAGPTLDYSINILKKDENPFIISTDTAFSTLQKNKIIPDIVISIDGQNVSINHFYNSISKKTVFLFDLCSNSSAAKYIYEHNGNIIFFKSGHPLAELANIYSGKKIQGIFTGSGTVTIAALDLAVKLGFSNIFVLGADFGYSNGKAYTKGTYFDALFNKNSDRIMTNENNFNKLLYRIPLITADNRQTTEILNAYKLSFEDYISSLGLKYEYSNNIYKIINNLNNKIEIHNPQNFDFTSFYNYIKNLSTQDLEIPLLPYIAWVRTSSKVEDFDELLKLAHSFILSYN